MTILAVVQRVAMAVGIARPLSVYAAPSREMQEMQAVADEAAATIASAFDWQALLQKQTITGTGSAEAFDLPADYRRMPIVGELWLSRTRAMATHIVTLDDWLALDFRPISPIEGAWTVFGNQIRLRPVMSAGETARFFYVRNGIVSGGKTGFTADDDSFVLNERLLRLCMIYLWKQEKGQDFAAELSDYEIALALATRRDGGSLPTLSGNGGARSSNVWPGKVSG